MNPDRSETTFCQQCVDKARDLLRYQVRVNELEAAIRSHREQTTDYFRNESDDQLYGTLHDA